MTPEEAKARLRQLGRDPGWSTRFNARDVTAQDEYNGLMKIITSAGPPAAVTPTRQPGDVERAPLARDQIEEWKRDPAFRSKVIAGDKDAVRMWNTTVEISGADK